MATSLTRVVGFHAVHRFFRPDWTEVQNREAFGPLSDPPGHAHDYHCAVTVRGETPQSGCAGVRLRTDAPDLRGHRRVHLSTHLRQASGRGRAGARAHYGG